MPFSANDVELLLSSSVGICTKLWEYLFIERLI